MIHFIIFGAEGIIESPPAKRKRKIEETDSVKNEKDSKNIDKQIDEDEKLKNKSKVIKDKVKRGKRNVHKRKQTDKQGDESEKKVTETKKKKKKKYVLFVGNLSLKTTAEDVKEHFREIGQCTDSVYLYYFN